MGQALSPRKRREIIEFDPRSGAESVRGFCHRLQIGTSSFYRIRALAREQGVAAAMVPGSRAPLRPARVYGDFTDRVIVTVRGELVEQGVEAGPWSIWWRLVQDGVVPLPSRSTIARRLRALGLIEPSPAKRPRSSYRRFQRSKANELWQLDAIEWRLAGRLVTIHQIVDDATRMMVALIAVPGGETTHGAITALQTGFDDYGKPAAVLTDNHRSVNQHRYGQTSSTETWLAAQGIRPISGQIGHPQTQGKTERAHQPVRNWLAHHPADTLDELTTVLNRFHHHYNHYRQHQGLGIAITPAMAWAAIPKDAPLDHPIPIDQLYGRQPRSLPPQPDRPTTGQRHTDTEGRINWAARVFFLGKAHAGQTIHIIHTTHHVELFDTDGVQIAHIPWPQSGTKKQHINITRPPFRLPQNPPPPPSQKP